MKGLKKHGQGVEQGPPTSPQGQSGAKSQQKSDSHAKPARSNDAQTAQGALEESGGEEEYWQQSPKEEVPEPSRWSILAAEHADVGVSARPDVKCELSNGLRRVSHA